MKPLLHQHWTAYVVVVAMLFNVVTPASACQCVGCPFKGNADSSLPVKETFGNGGCRSCCKTPAVPPYEKPTNEPCGCGSPGVPCRCHDVHKESAVMPDASSLGKKPSPNQSWTFLITISTGFTNASRVSSRLEHHRILMPPHVPLHVLLCTFLN